MLFKMAGLGQQQGDTGFNQQLELAKLQELLAQGSSERGLKGSAEERAQRLQDESIAESKATRDLAERKFAYEQSQAGEKAKGETEKQAMDFAGKMVAAGNTAGALQVLGAYSGPAADMIRKAAQTEAETKGRAFQKQLKGIYEQKNPKALQATMDQLEAMPDVVKAIDWNKLKWGGEQKPGGETGFADQGAIGMAYNIPGALQNVGKGAVNLGLRIAAGKDAPQVDYTKFTDPNVRQMLANIKESSQKVLPGEGGAAGQTTYNLASTGAAPWRYGTGDIQGPVQQQGPAAPQAPPRPLYETPYANEADIANRINADPRFQLEPEASIARFKNWWNQPSAPSSVPPGSFPSVEDLVARSRYQTPPSPTSVAMPEATPMPNQVNPAAMMPGGQQQVAPNLQLGSPEQAREPGFVNWLMNLVNGTQQQNVAAAQEMPWTYGRQVLPTSQPLPTPYPAEFQDILQQ
jgi:hypothetical protein